MNVHRYRNKHLVNKPKCLDNTARFTYLTPTINNLLKSHNSELSQPVTPPEIVTTLLDKPGVFSPSSSSSYWGEQYTTNGELTLGHFLFHWLICLILDHDTIKGFTGNNISKVTIDLYINFDLPLYWNQDAQLCMYKIYCALTGKPVPDSYPPPSPAFHHHRSSSRRRRSSTASLPTASAAMEAAAAPFKKCKVDETLNSDEHILKCANNNFSDQYAMIQSPHITTVVNMNNGTTDAELNGDVDMLREALSSDGGNREIDFTVPYLISPRYIDKCTVEYQDSVFRPMRTFRDLLITLPPHQYDAITRIEYYCELYNVCKPSDDYEKYLAMPCGSFMCVMTSAKYSDVRPAILHHRCVYDILEEPNMTKAKFLKLHHALTHYVQQLKAGVKNSNDYICAVDLLVDSLTEENEGLGVTVCNIIKEFRVNKSINIVNTMFTVTTAEEVSLRDISFERQRWIGDEYGWVVKYDGMEFR